MTQYPTINDGDVLNASDLTLPFRNIMQILTGFGKGVQANPDGSKGLVLSPGSSPGKVAISPGIFVHGQAGDRVAFGYEFAIGNNASGYVWIQADDTLDNEPVTEITATNADPGSLWVCLGHASSNASGAVTVSEDGRQVFGTSLVQPLDSPIRALVVDHYDTQVRPQVAEMIEAAIPTERAEFFTGDGSARAFTLTYVPRPGSLTVTMANPINLNLGGRALTFDAPPPNGASVKVQYSWVIADQ